MSEYPKNGTYVSGDGVYKITIASSNAGDGSITGTYSSAFGHYENPQDVRLVGGFSWVKNKGTAGTAPFAIRFNAGDRPDAWDRCAYEDWTGYYMQDNTIIAYGSRATVVAATDTAEAQVSTETLGGLAFYLKS